MARLNTMPEPMRSHLSDLPCPTFDTRPWMPGPPRALWVPFVLGRPLGRPGDPAFQMRVTLAALALLESETGPVLIDFPDNAPDVSEPARNEEGRPDVTLPDDTAFNRWFWQKTAAGEALRAVRDNCRAADDAALKLNGDLLLVPMDQTSP
ncbi:MAG: hypothetical protein AB1Z81_16035 [Desulfotignum sp.]